MANLNNSNRDLIEGLVLLLRKEIDSYLPAGSNSWSSNSEHGVKNVWGKKMPDSARNEFPRGSVDIISGTDVDLSVELDVKLREVIVRIVVWGELPSDVEDLWDASEDAIGGHWESYTADWSLRQVDGFTELTENEEDRGELRYNRSIDFVFETVKED